MTLYRDRTDLTDETRRQLFKIYVSALEDSEPDLTVRRANIVARFGPGPYYWLERELQPVWLDGRAPFIAVQSATRDEQHPGPNAHNLRTDLVHTARDRLVYPYRYQITRSDEGGPRAAALREHYFHRATSLDRAYLFWIVRRRTSAVLNSNRLTVGQVLQLQHKRVGRYVDVRVIAANIEAGWMIGEIEAVRTTKQ